MMRHLQDTAAVSHTADDLVAAARTHGFTDVSRRLVTEWTGEGLLCSPEFHKSTRHGSDRRRYPAPQRNLFLFLLKSRQENRGTRHQHTLMLHLVAYQWMHQWSDIPTEQARRALRTLARKERRLQRSASHARAKAREIVNAVAHPSAAPLQTRKARHLLEHSMKTGVWHWDQVESALTEVCSPWPAPPEQRIHRSLPHGPAPFGVPEAVAQIRGFLGNLEALSHEYLSEEQLDEARRRYLQVYGEKALARARLLFKLSKGSTDLLVEHYYAMQNAFSLQLIDILNEAKRTPVK
ncbi:hypothetical protein ACWGJX_33345 [Streptomyces sp. NPDC054775]